MHNLRSVSFLSARIAMIAMIAMTALAACAGERMATPKHFARSAIEMEIEGTAQKGMDALWFGDFAVIGMDEKPRVSVRRAEQVTEERKYSFTLLDREGTNWTTECSSTRKYREVSPDQKIPGAVLLRCAIDSDAKQQLELRLQGSTSGKGSVLGEVRSAKGNLEIISAHQVVDGNTAKEVDHALGFEIHFENQLVAAVQTKGSPTIWLAPGIRAETVRSVAGVSAAALVFFDN